MFKQLVSPRLWGYGLFWVWNAIFLTFMLLGFAPAMLPNMIEATRGGVIPLDFLVYALILTAIPALMVLLAVYRLRDRPLRLFMLGYGVEGPLMLVLVLRLFAARELTPSLALLLFVATIGVLTFLWHLLDFRFEERGLDAQEFSERVGWLAWLRLIGLSLLLVVGLYAALWFAFYALPLTGFMVREAFDIIINIPRFFADIIQSLRYMNWLWIPMYLIGMVLFALTSFLLAALPIVITTIYVRTWWRTVRGISTRSGSLPALGVTAAVVLALSGLSFLTYRQPQGEAFATLSTTPTSPDEARARLGQAETIRAGLLNAYLAPQRYVSSIGEIYHVSDMYRNAFNTSEGFAAQVQGLYEQVAWPILYRPAEYVADPSVPRWQNGAFLSEPQRASELYQQFFDAPINMGERETVVHAVRSTWSVDQATSAWQAVDEREVLLKHQQLSIVEQGDWADMELYEVYQNQTDQRQEVVYYFSLPESAVITGVWLGGSDDRTRRFTYQVAPRGAAQQVYRNEVRRNVDPALVEQIGPRQYRLRVFPIEPKTWDWNENSNRSTLRDGPEMHMWLTWRVLANEGSWPLPQLAEKRNVYWENSAQRSLNGATLNAGERWLPETVPMQNAVAPAAHRVDFADGRSVLARPSRLAELPPPSGDLQLAVVLDRSYSMTEQADTVQRAFERLRALGNLGAQVDVYLSASEYRGEGPQMAALNGLDTSDIFYYGGQDASELLSQFASLRAGRGYDAVLVLTDGSGYELGESKATVPQLDVPLWMVHLGGALPLGYDDATLEVIQASGGGVAGGIEEALTRLDFARQVTPGSADLIDDYLWELLPTAEAAARAPEATQHNADTPFAALAARRLIIGTMAEQRGSADPLAALDGLHAIAVEQSIVTPYSSMIVLVNSEQQRMLDELAQQEDRFEREFEEVGETTNGAPPVVTGVPEPEEWLLIGLAVAMMAWWLRQRARRPVTA
jgi:putative PEP-CTERM system integral membrane protein